MIIITTTSDEENQIWKYEDSHVDRKSQEEHRELNNLKEGD